EIRYPKRAVRRNLEGRLELDVTMTAEGEVLSIQVALPSGHGLLDEAALAAARSALEDGLSAELDPVAIAEFGDFASGQLTVPVPVSFQLQ
ncbi:MAG: TonB family protein, partial [Halioglobus sp.]|nr:TonB family protein [Halioglobus sp.]